MSLEVIKPNNENSNNGERKKFQLDHGLTVESNGLSTLRTYKIGDRIGLKTSPPYTTPHVVIEGFTDNDLVIIYNEENKKYQTLTLSLLKAMEDTIEI
jgi:hypothetical protein